MTLENTTLFMFLPPHSPNITTIHIKIKKIHFNFVSYPYSKRISQNTSLRAVSYCVMPEVSTEQSHLYLHDWNHYEKL